MKRLLEEFRKLPDYWNNRVAYTNPSEILFLSLLAVLSVVNSFEDMAIWMKERKYEIAKLLSRGFTYRIKSVFKYGLEWLKNVLVNASLK